MDETPFRPPLERGEAADSPPAGGEAPVDRALRPRSLRDFVGQRALVSNLEVAIEAARLREEPLEHLLLSGLPGLGKTTLSEIVARELGVALHATSGPIIERPADLAGLLTGLGRGDVLFIDEIHRVPRTVEEYLYSAMEDFKLVIMLDQGPRSRSVPVSLQPFTLIGATTREGLLSAPFRARFGLHERVEPYDDESLERILHRSAGLLELEVDDEAVGVLASRSRGTPRVANRYLRRLRDAVQVAGARGADGALARSALERLGVDEEGLLLLDRRLLEALAHAHPHPVGLKALAVTVGEEERTVEEVYEPWLIRRGWVTRTPRGRALTESGLERARRGQAN